MVQTSAPFHLLTGVIHSSYRESMSQRRATNGVVLLAERTVQSAGSGFCAGSALFETDAENFLRNRHLEAEIFGPATQLIRNATHQHLLQIARELDGHLTATIHGTAADLRQYADLIAVLETKVGRLVVNGFPTGVEVSHAMVHGGPYPSTSDGRSTSVGTRAIFRFVRPVCYQAFPDEALPDELKNANPLGIWRMVDGKITRDAIPPAAEGKKIA
jgi:NADP-dependent aldehyde dehydrogenase